MEINDFEFNPILKDLLINYFGITYEMTATDDQLLAEYNWLLRENKLEKLFDCETLSKKWRAGLS